MTTMREISTEHICSPRFRDMREGVTLQRLGCTTLRIPISEGGLIVHVGI